VSDGARCKLLEDFSAKVITEKESLKRELEAHNAVYHTMRDAFMEYKARHESEDARGVVGERSSLEEFISETSGTADKKRGEFALVASLRSELAAAQADAAATKSAADEREARLLAKLEETYSAESYSADEWAEHSKEVEKRTRDVCEKHYNDEREKVNMEREKVDVRCKTEMIKLAKQVDADARADARAESEAKMSHLKKSNSGQLAKLRSAMASAKAEASAREAALKGKLGDARVKLMQLDSSTLGCAPAAVDAVDARKRHADELTPGDLTKKPTDEMDAHRGPSAGHDNAEAMTQTHESDRRAWAVTTIVVFAVAADIAREATELEQRLQAERDVCAKLVERSKKTEDELEAVSKEADDAWDNRDEWEERSTKIEKEAKRAAEQVEKKLKAALAGRRRAGALAADGSTRRYAQLGAGATRQAQERDGVCEGGGERARGGAQMRAEGRAREVGARKRGAHEDACRRARCAAGVCDC
jgi:hypothetical protein